MRACAPSRGSGVANGEDDKGTMCEGDAPALKKARKEAENDQPKMSKKKVREVENGRCVGGLRQP